MAAEREVPIDPELPVIDSHQHLFDRAGDWLVALTGYSRFLIEEYTDFVSDGHNVIASVALEASSMYAHDGPEELRPVGETEFLDGQAAMGATGLYNNVRVAAGIVGGANLRLGDSARAVLEAHLSASPRRFRGIRQEAMWDPDPRVLGSLPSKGPQLYLDDSFRRGFAHLGPLGLSFDAFVLHPQLPDVLDLARSFPGTQIILNHLGRPVAIGPYEGRQEEVYAVWRAHMQDIAACENVTVKMGGYGSFLSGSPTFKATPPASSEVLAAEWRPWTETTIELFGAERVMFETNIPTDGSGPFTNICNAFKRITADCSQGERVELFAGTAARVYRLDVDIASARNAKLSSDSVVQTHPVAGVEGT